MYILSIYETKQLCPTEASDTHGLFQVDDRPLLWARVPGRNVHINGRLLRLHDHAPE